MLAMRAEPTQVPTKPITAQAALRTREAMKYTNVHAWDKADDWQSWEWHACAGCANLHGTCSGTTTFASLDDIIPINTAVHPETAYNIYKVTCGQYSPIGCVCTRGQVGVFATVHTVVVLYLQQQQQLRQ